MTGSAWLICDNGETDGAIMAEGSIIGEGDKKGMLYGVLKSAAGMGTETGFGMKKPGLAKSEASLAVAEMGNCCISIPYPEEVSI